MSGKSGFSFNQCGPTKRVSTVKTTGLFDVKEECKEVGRTKTETTTEPSEEKPHNETRDVDKDKGKDDRRTQRNKAEDNEKDSDDDKVCEGRMQSNKSAIAIPSKTKSPFDKNEKPSFLSAMMENAARRKVEQEKAQIRMRRAREGVSGEGVFVTNAYKKKLEDMASRGHKDILEDDDDRGRLQTTRFYSNIGAVYDRGDSNVARERSPDRRKYKH